LEWPSEILARNMPWVGMGRIQTSVVRPVVANQSSVPTDTPVTSLVLVKWPRPLLSNFGVNIGVYTMVFQNVDGAWSYIKGSCFDDKILLGESASSNPVEPDDEMQVRCHVPTSVNGCARCTGTGWLV
jgi:hypothetical protein